MARNRVRSTDDPRLVALAESLAQYLGPVALPAAAGYIFLLNHHVYATLSDLLGTPEDVESICHWHGPTRVLFVALRASGYLGECEGILVSATAAIDAPEFVRKRWMRHNRASWDAAIKRAGKPALASLSDDVEEVVEPEPFTTDLFGQPITGDANGKVHPPAAERPGHREFVLWWGGEYVKRAGRAYPWSAQDFRHVSTILKSAKDQGVAREWATRYLANADRYYLGWPLSKLANPRGIAQFSRQRVLATGQSDTPTEFRYTPARARGGGAEANGAAPPPVEDGGVPDAPRTEADE